MRGRLVLGWMGAAAMTVAQAQQSADLPPVTPAGRPSIGLALEGGGALGLAHVGVLQWLEEHHIPIDRISGTSMGALVGGLYATGMTPAQLRAIAVSNAFSNVFTVQVPYTQSSFRRREDQRDLPQSIEVGLHHGPHLRNAFFADRGVDEFLETNFTAYNAEGLNFDDLPIPFRCVATDLNTLQSVTYARGPLPEAVRASISIPGVFSPVMGHDGHALVDGGILDNLPTDVLRNELHADRVIAIDLTVKPVVTADISSIVAVLNRAFSAGIERNVAQNRRLADVVVSVPVDKWTTTDYRKAAALIEAGYQAAEASKAALLPYALDDAGWSAYTAARAARRAALPGVVREVKVDSNIAAARRKTASDLQRLEGKPLSAAATLHAMRPIESNGEFGATWDTYRSNDGDLGVNVRVKRDIIGPPYVLISPELAAATANVTRAEMGLRFIDQDFGGFGSELRATGRIGYMTEVRGEYYRLLTPSGFFVEPKTGLLRMPVYLWQDQKRVAERFQQNLDAGLEAGKTFTPHMQISAEWLAQDTRWSLTTGTGGGPYLSGTAQTGLVKLAIDRAESGTVSPNGFRLLASAGALYHAVGSANAPEVNLAFSRTRPWGNNIFGIGGTLSSYLRANVAQPFRFTMGGPMRLSALSIDEYRGTDTYLARTGIMHRIAALPTGLGQGVYATLMYEAGEMWSPESNAILRQDGATGLVANTPIGLVTVGLSVGDAGHRKVFVTLGRWF